MIYTYLGALVSFSFVILSMAEMASMYVTYNLILQDTNINRAPTSGGQYHWVSEFAPPSCQALLSYITGWICVLGWHTGIAGCCYTVGNMIIGLVIINYPDTYTYQGWHVALLVIAVAIVAVAFNTLLAQKLPVIEGIILFIHIFGFVGILVPLWVLSPKIPASEVFGSIEDRGGWGNNGLSCLVGMIGPIYALMGMSFVQLPGISSIQCFPLVLTCQGPDSAVHMGKDISYSQVWLRERTNNITAEEIQDASYVLPWGMVATLILNGSTGFIMVITYVFCVGDITEVLKNDKTGFPFIQVFLNATGSVRTTTGMTIVIMVMQFCAGISNVATTSRQIYSFARDRGLPFSDFFSHVSQSTNTIHLKLN